VHIVAAAKARDLSRGIIARFDLNRLIDHPARTAREVDWYLTENRHDRAFLSSPCCRDRTTMNAASNCICQLAWIKGSDCY
jgi:hypothetical protein